MLGCAVTFCLTPLPKAKIVQLAAPVSGSLSLEWGFPFCCLHRLLVRGESLPLSPTQSCRHISRTSRVSNKALVIPSLFSESVSADFLLWILLPDFLKHSVGFLRNFPVFLFFVPLSLTCGTHITFRGICFSSICLPQLDSTPSGGEIFVSKETDTNRGIKWPLKSICWMHSRRGDVHIWFKYVLIFLSACLPVWADTSLRTDSLNTRHRILEFEENLGRSPNVLVHPKTLRPGGMDWLAPRAACRASWEN